MPHRMLVRSLLGVASIAVPCAVAAQDVSGRVFEDRNANGTHDPGEPFLEGVMVELYGQSGPVGSTSPVDTTDLTAADGSFSFAPGDGCYLVRPLDPDGWRLTNPRPDAFPEGSTPEVAPVGQPRFGKLDQGIDHLRAGTLRYTAMGDSIATNFDWCDNIFGNFLYSRRLRDRMNCTVAGTPVTLDQAAVKGEHTDDLLVDDNNDLNNVFRVIEIQPQLVSISMIGNDLLDVEGQGPQVAVPEILDARRNLQEALSAMLSEVPGLDITLNTLYDNESYDCYNGTSTSALHREWLPIVNRILRDLAWGQIRRVSVNEIAAEFAREDLLAAPPASCTGFGDLICLNVFPSDFIHPTQDGYDVITEKLWEAAAGVNLGSRDVLNRAAQTAAGFGYLRRVRRLFPTAWEQLGGATAANPAAALDGDDGGAAASIALGLGSQEFRLSGFPDWFDEIKIAKVVVGVNYRTTGTFADDLYRIEASPTGQFRPPPGHVYTPTDWNFHTPIVGGGGPDAPAQNPDYPNARLLVLPQVVSYRSVAATLTKNPEVPAGSAEYVWPALTHDDIATTEVRIAAAPVGSTPGTDGRIELDAAWLDLYGWELPRPGDVQAMRVERLADGTLEVSFDPLPEAQRYNLYFGRLATLRTGQYDHGAAAPVPAWCDAPTSDAGGGRLKIVVSPGQQPAEDAYLIVTAHDADDVESPAGYSSDGGEIDRAQSVCR